MAATAIVFPIVIDELGLQLDDARVRGIVKIVGGVRPHGAHETYSVMGTYVNLSGGSGEVCFIK